MAQPSVSSFFITRKRGIEDDVIASKKKVICLEKNSFSNSIESTASVTTADDFSNKIVYPSINNKSNDGSKEEKMRIISSIASVRQGITSQRTRSSKKVQMQNVEGIQAPKVVNFWMGSSLSPQKKSRKQTEVIPVKNDAIEEKDDDDDQPLTRINKDMKTPKKKSSTTNLEKHGIEKTLLFSNNCLNTNELKRKLHGNARLTELKTSLNKLRNGFDKLDQMEKRRNTNSTIVSSSLKEDASATSNGSSLKPFRNIELEILSPKKSLTSPMKLKDSPMKNTLIGSPKILTPKKLLFSPTKSSPIKAPAYERFQNLVEPGTPNLQLPFKYRYLLEVFKAIDTVCAMFFNRKEKITFKKLKPAVQRILRKNFYESHLAQIQKLMPNAYIFAIAKTRNFGSTSKQDYYQLIITPNIKASESDDNFGQIVLSPQILIERMKKMTELLTDIVYIEHEKFLQTLDVPMNITRGALKRWHPDFPLESVPDLEQGELPQPPNVEKFSSAKDVLSTARNLFNCSTPMERALERLEAKGKEEKLKQVQNREQRESIAEAVTPSKEKSNNEKKKNELIATESSSSLLKGVPKSLLDKIRAKQAAKALDAMTRRPSQERDATKYSRLPEVARHVRNVFVTEKKGVLPLEIVLTKIENSYKACVSLKEIEELLRLISNEFPRWLSFHEIRNMMFVKVNRDNDLTDIIDKLQSLANQKAQIQ